jgi:cell fate (sporulation/competence/biofilm development) regulator YlbF (YheA/YmcA/DUF963 family)
MLEDKAAELGRLIGQSSEYLAVKRANEALTQDSEAVQLLRQIDELRNKAQSAIAGGTEPSPEMEAELDSLLSTLQRQPTYQRAVSAQENFDKLMLRINNWILDGMRRGAASPIITLG